MSRFNTLAGIGAAAALAGLVAACNPDAKVHGPRLTGDETLFTNYVALGNSITAGFQSDGINDSTQVRSYAVLLARAMGTRFAIPTLNKPGCRPPIRNFVTQARVSDAPAQSCALRATAGATDILNNVAVPGHKVVDATALAGGNPTVSDPNNLLTQLILGGRSQVTRALEADPTFLSIWLGNNDVLQPVLSGMPNNATPQATFEQQYNSMLDQLLAGAPNLKGGVLIGVANAVLLPYLFPAAALASPAFKGFVDQAAGGTVLVLPNCTGSSSLIGIGLLSQMRSGAHPRVISCAKGDPLVQPPVGDIFILDAAEQGQALAIVAGYNDFLEEKAAELDFAFWDPNVLFGLLSERAGGSNEIPNVLNPASATPFGALISLDGVHPSSAGHIRMVNALIGAINAKYSTTLPTQ
jgi:hypothetical protein